MTDRDARIVGLWEQGLPARLIAQRMGVRVGKLSGELDRLRQAGRIKPRSAPSVTLVVPNGLLPRLGAAQPAEVRVRAPAPDATAPYRPGRPYAVRTMQLERNDVTQVVRRRAVVHGHAEVIATGAGWLHETTDEDARKCGFEDRQTLLEVWWERHKEGPGWDTTASYYPVMIPIFVLALRAVETRRFLAVGTHRPPDEAGYTWGPEGALKGEPEAVPLEDQDRFSMESDQDKTARAKRYEQWLRELPLHDRLRIVEERARLADVDISRKLKAARRQIQQAENMVSRFAA